MMLVAFLFAALTSCSGQTDNDVSKGCNCIGPCCSCEASECRETDNPCCQCSENGCQCKCNGCASNIHTDDIYPRVSMTDAQRQFSVNYEQFLRSMDSQEATRVADDIARQRDLIDNQQFKDYYFLVTQTNEDYKRLTPEEVRRAKDWVRAQTKG